MGNKKILIIGTINDFCLETSYAKAARELGYEVLQFDPQTEVGKHIKFGMVGKKINDFLPVEVWLRKMNRHLIITAKEYSPAFIFVFGTAKILFGTFLTIRIILPQAKLVWVWPDTPMNLSSINLDNCKMFDAAAIYSRVAVEACSKIGFENCHWLPLAGDEFLHGTEISGEDNFDCDISFVGMWRPEREKVMRAIFENFNQQKIELHGNYWKRDCSYRPLLSLWKSEGFYGKDLGRFFNKSRININIIDETNYPAANMRFFEIPVAGGLQLSSKCPELEDDFKEGKTILYYKDEDQLLEKIQWVFDNTETAHSIRTSAQTLAKENHTYMNRLTTLFELLNN